MRQAITAVLVGSVLLLLAAAHAFAGEPRRVVLWGQRVAGADGSADTAEVVGIDDRLAPDLLAAKPDAPLRLAEFPLEPGRRAAVTLERREIYAPGAKVFRVEAAGPREIPRSRLVFFVGGPDDERDSRVVAAIDPDARTISGFALTPRGTFEFGPEGADPRRLLVADLKARNRALGAEPHWECGAEDLPAAPASLFASAASSSLQLPAAQTDAAAAAATTLERATIAVDTDNEWMLKKFNNDQTQATNYLAQLFAGITAIYERDLSVRMLQGTTYLRPSTQADPYTQGTGGNASSAELQEFGTYWTNNYASVKRALAILFSGKQSSANSSSGIAWVDALCNTSYGYAFDQTFTFSGATAADDVMVAAHELGHNFGSPHTHCYSPPIDQCYSGESGCYSGATSCPAAQTINGVTNVKGTLMSYCHLLSGCSTSNVFHPRSVSLVSPKVAAEVGVCIYPATGAGEASAQGTMKAARGTSGAVTVTYGAACGSSGSTIYAGDLTTLRSTGVKWTQRACGVGTSGATSFTPSAASSYFVIVGNDGQFEGSYGRSSSGAERPAAAAGGSCSYQQLLGTSCP